MKSRFPEYYRVTREALKSRFEELVFIFDANALLDIFRLPNPITREVFEVLERYSDQIEIPYHAAEEYNGRIHSVLQEQLRNINTAQSAFNEFVKSLEAKRNQPYISANSAKKLKMFKNSIQRDFQVQREYLLDQLLHGEFQNKMSEVLDGRVLPPFTAEEIQQIEAQGAKRYEQKIPPGWKDKGENAYGDLINWKEILRYAKEHQKSVVLVTNDQKTDWMCKYEGKTICPHYELLREFYQTVDNNQLVFHIYTLDRFLDFVHDHDKDSVSEDAISQVREVLNENNVMEMFKAMAKMEETFAKISEVSSKYKGFSDVLGKIYPNSIIPKEEIDPELCMSESKDDDIKITDDSQSSEKNTLVDGVETTPDGMDEPPKEENDAM